jgi:hypothetical protein
LSLIEEQSIQFLSIEPTVVSLQQDTLGPHTHTHTHTYTHAGMEGIRVGHDRCGGEREESEHILFIVQVSWDTGSSDKGGESRQLYHVLEN